MNVIVIMNMNMIVMSQHPAVKASKKITIVPADSEFVNSIRSFLLFDEKPEYPSDDDE